MCSEFQALHRSGFCAGYFAACRLGAAIFGETRYLGASGCFVPQGHAQLTAPSGAIEKGPPCLMTSNALHFHLPRLFSLILHLISSFIFAEKTGMPQSLSGLSVTRAVSLGKNGGDLFNSLRTFFPSTFSHKEKNKLGSSKRASAQRGMFWRLCSAVV